MGGHLCGSSAGHRGRGGCCHRRAPETGRSRNDRSPALLRRATASCSGIRAPAGLGSFLSLGAAVREPLIARAPGVAAVRVLMSPTTTPQPPLPAPPPPE